MEKGNKESGMTKRRKCSSVDVKCVKGVCVHVKNWMSKRRSRWGLVLTKGGQRPGPEEGESQSV